MPGYRPLPETTEGGAARDTRAAEMLQQAGDFSAAVVMLESALTETIVAQTEIPGWLCGRLACLYRSLGRYDDEVDLIERYRESQSCEKARSRYDARLSKARAMAEKHRRRDSGALASVRRVRSDRRSELQRRAQQPDVS
jgi:hypothetical protein